MARKRKTSTAEDLMDLIAMLPWWAGIALALTSYMVLHSIAIRPLPAAQSPQQIDQLATSAIWQGLAIGGQYILPLICLAGAAISAECKRRRSQLLELPRPVPARMSCRTCHGENSKRWSMKEFEPRLPPQGVFFNRSQIHQS